MLRTMRVQREARHRVHENRLAQRRAGPRQTALVKRRLVRHERQRHELGDAVRALLQRRAAGSK